MRSKKKVQRKRSVRLRGHPEPETLQEEDQFLKEDEELDREFFELDEPDDFDINLPPDDESEW
ncbi:MAG: hypothetical protein K6T77_00765 [candidate division WOR-3 bacterium]|jgi:hypothetical protein|nr:hypothetical protein [candidate division WOR-3 bacterium]MCR4423966.1 hypothetical protein [candidate division WOR-3 bacterium]MDH7519615.1 hypothetical protein [bacterium]